MNRSQARELAELVKSMAHAAVFHSDEVYDICSQIEEKLLEIFPEDDNE